jgi:hypothetical protein
MPCGTCRVSNVADEIIGKLDFSGHEDELETLGLMAKRDRILIESAAL